MLPPFLWRPACIRFVPAKALFKTSSTGILLFLFSCIDTMHRFGFETAGVESANKKLMP